MNRLNRSLSAIILFFLLLGARNGYLALWKQEDPMPVKIYPVRISSLPPADQLLLRRGIRVEDLPQLQALLEDYL